MRRWLEKRDFASAADFCHQKYLQLILIFMGMFLALCLAPSAAVAQGAEIGVVRTIDGAAFVERGGNRMQPAVGDPVLAGDVLKTGDDGAIGVALSDNAVLSLGRNSEFHLVEFVFEPRRHAYSFLARVLLGTFIYVSGDIGRLSPDSVTIETPIGTIGIRGTRFAGSVSP